MKKFKSIFNRNKAIMNFLFIIIIGCVVLVTVFEDREFKISTVLPIENIKINGKFENILKTDIKLAVVDVIRGGYFTVDIDAIRSALIELPWVDEASVRRQWPAGLNITVIEKRAISYWGEDSLLSDKGVLFTPKIVDSGLMLPQLDGPTGLHRTVWVFLQGTNKKIKSLAVHVKRLTLDRRRSWEIRLSNNVAIKLGREDTEFRLQRLVKVFASDYSPKMQNIESIDLRYPNGFAMRMKNKESENNNKSTLVIEV